MSEYVSCLQTADPIIATNYKASITVTVLFDGEKKKKKKEACWGLSMGIHSSGLTCQLSFVLMDEDRKKNEVLNVYSLSLEQRAYINTTEK